MKWLRENVTRWEVYLLCSFVCVVSIVYIHWRVAQEISATVSELRESVNDFRDLMEEFKAVKLTQNNNQQVFVPDNEATLRDKRIKANYEANLK